MYYYSLGMINRVKTNQIQHRSDVVRMTMNKIANRLVNEKSPYLLQHAYNPVQWYPWGDEAFAKAKAEDKPIFLSIGYSTCHWCHVMERESFEDQEVADQLNQHYVSIKVDREERPDIDTIYMSVCQALTGHGGWPLTVIMTPDRKPFFAGTYYPKHSQRGMPGIMDVLSQLSQLWQEKREELVNSSAEIVEAVQKSYLQHEQGTLDKDIFHRTYKYFADRFDEQYGGFGNAPKFPTPHNLTFLLRYWKLTGETKAIQMVEKTLTSMYQGGIYDHVGFGFCRYSTDGQWLVPHFEKMLYDNALLAIAYLETYQATKNDFYGQVAKEIFTYILRDMTSPEGVFYSAEDADSEGEEGKFYVWSVEEIKEVLGEEKGAQYCLAYDITGRGNFEGKSIPNLIKTGVPGNYQVEGNRLFLHREQRIHPFKDDKILTSWNGLMIAALAFGSRVLEEGVLAEAAEKAVQFIINHLINEEGRLLARFRDGEAAVPAYAEDFAYLIWGLIELYQSTFNSHYLKLALELTHQLEDKFWDEHTGGFFQYGSDAEQLISRPKELYDGALPSGNSVMATNLLRLSALTGDPAFSDQANIMFEAFGGTVNTYPMGHTHFLMAEYLRQAPSVEITIVGDFDSKETKRLLDVVNRPFLPELVLVGKEPDSQDPVADDLIHSLKERQPIDNLATAYVCKAHACQPPITDAKELQELVTP